MTHYDCIIMGSGAGGGTLAYVLASAGKKVLLLERGDFLPREKANWSPKAVFMDKRYKAKETFYDINGRPFHPSTSYCVGGNTKVYGAALLRFRKEDFGPLRHKEGISPAWPLSYEEFQPYYLQAERLYQVHGERHTDPTEPPEEAPYPFPALKHEPRMQKLFDGFKSKGLRPFPLPLGLMLNEKDRENSTCIRCDTCDGYPCLVDAKCDSEVTCIKKALTFSNFTLLTNTKAVRLETDSTGRSVKRVEAEHHGKTEYFTATTFVASCGAINSSALLLRSKNDPHPQGLANSSGMVGRNYMYHNCTVILGVTKTPNLDNYVKTFSINDYYLRSPEYEYPLGHIQLIGNVKKEMFPQPAHTFVPDGVLDRIARHAIGLFICSEDLPSPNNRVMLGPKGEIQLHYTPNNLEGHFLLRKKVKDLLKSMEIGIYLSQGMSVTGVGHQVGSCCFGTDPKKTVLDVNCKAHDLDNLYVVDSSFFPSSAAVNPALTIIANALRVGEHLVKNT